MYIPLEASFHGSHFRDPRSPDIDSQAHFKKGSYIASQGNDEMSCRGFFTTGEVYSCPAALNVCQAKEGLTFTLDT